MPFVSKEKLQKPRILLLDFSDAVGARLENERYEIIIGKSGFSGQQQSIPKHSSEIELIFWNCEKIKFLPENPMAHVNRMGIGSKNRKYVGNLEEYVTNVRNKGGTTTVFLGTENSDYGIISLVTGCQVNFKPRTTSTIFREDQEHLWGNFLMQYVIDENIRFSIQWNDNLDNYFEFFTDEAENGHACIFKNQLIILPKLERVESAILFLLQDFLPYICNEEIFPDLAKYKWLNEEAFTLNSIKEKQTQLEALYKQYVTEKEAIENAIQNDIQKFGYLNQALVADDSQLFKDEDKLKKQVIQMLLLIGFTVVNVDMKNSELGKSLKEDLQIQDDAYFAIGEVKGTEQGAKANWVKQDLQTHITTYIRIHNKDLREINGMLIFNHERKVDPRKRKSPYGSDPELVKYCQLSQITLIPVFQLYQLCMGIINGEITKEAAKEELKIPGLYAYLPNNK